MVLVMMLLMCFTTSSAFAYSKSVQLTRADKWVDSAPLSGISKAKITSGSNSGNSDRSVYFIIQNKTSSGYNDHVHQLAKPGSNAPKLTSTGGVGTYRLELNPYGTNTKGCSALGTITSI